MRYLCIVYNCHGPDMSDTSYLERPFVQEVIGNMESLTSQGHLIAASPQGDLLRSFWNPDEGQARLLVRIPEQQPAAAKASTFARAEQAARRIFGPDAYLTGMSYLLLLMVVFLVLGMFVDTVLCLTLVAPLLVPVAIAQGADPVALGMMVCLNLTMGLITPPLGGAIMMVASITGQNYWALCKRIMPFVLAELVVLVLIVVFPELSLAVPRWMGML